MAERVHYEVTVEVSREDLGDGRRRTKTRTYRVDADKMTEKRVEPYTPPGIYAWQHDPHRRRDTTHLLRFWRNNALVFTVDASTVVEVVRVGVRSNPSRKRHYRKQMKAATGKGINHYPWMKLSFALPFEALAEKRGAAKVARSYRGFFHAFKKAGGKGAKMGRTHKDTPGRGDSYMWWERRNEFISRHMAQVKKRGERLWKPNGEPTNRHLGLIMWAYTPDPDGVLNWVKAKRNGFFGRSDVHYTLLLNIQLDEGLHGAELEGTVPRMEDVVPQVRAAMEAVDFDRISIIPKGENLWAVRAFMEDAFAYGNLQARPRRGLLSGFALPNSATDLEGRYIPEKYLRGLTPAQRAQRIEELTASRSGTRYAELPTDKTARRAGLVRKGKYTKEAESRGIAHKGDYTDTAERALGYYRVPATDKNVKAVADALKKVWRKGMAAWKSGHRPGAGQTAWAYARINSFLTGGKTVKVDKKEFAALPEKMRDGILAEA